MTEKLEMPTENKDRKNSGQTALEARDTGQAAASVFPYEDIVDLPHHVSAKRSHMSMHDRAGQFSPFAALSGYGDAIDTAGKETEQSYLDEGYGEPYPEVQ